MLEVKNPPKESAKQIESVDKALSILECFWLASFDDILLDVVLPQGGQVIRQIEQLKVGRKGKRVLLARSYVLDSLSISGNEANLRTVVMPHVD